MSVQQRFRVTLGSTSGEFSVVIHHEYLYAGEWEAEHFMFIPLDQAENLAWEIQRLCEQQK